MRRVVVLVEAIEAVEAVEDNLPNCFHLIPSFQPYPIFENLLSYTL
jgi:hypothetical protein